MSLGEMVCNRIAKPAKTAYILLPIDNKIRLSGDDLFPKSLTVPLYYQPMDVSRLERGDLINVNVESMGSEKNTL